MTAAIFEARTLLLISSLAKSKQNKGVILEINDQFMYGDIYCIALLIHFVKNVIVSPYPRLRIAFIETFPIHIRIFELRMFYIQNTQVKL